MENHLRNTVTISYDIYHATIIPNLSDDIIFSDGEIKLELV